MTPEIGIESPAHSSSRGFTLIELIVVIAVMGIIAAIAIPSFFSWRSNLNASQSAKNVVDCLREARSKAMATNYQHEVAFDVQNGKYQMLRGTQSYNTPPTPGNPVNGWTTVVQNWVQLSTGVAMTSGNPTVNVQFNADGTARLETPAGTAVLAPVTTVTIGIQSGSSAKVHTISIATSGRISLD